MRIVNLIEILIKLYYDRSSKVREGSLAKSRIGESMVESGSMS